MTLELDIAC